jgi:hypothetical protein
MKNKSAFVTVISQRNRALKYNITYLDASNFAIYSKYYYIGDIR